MRKRVPVQRCAAQAPHDPDSDRGAVTVEGAIALSALLLIFGAILAGTSVLLDTLRCTDAAATAARLTARGDREGARRAVEAIAPPGATVAFRRTGQSVVVTVGMPPSGGPLPDVVVEREAYAVLEPGVRSPPAPQPAESRR